MPEHSTTVRDVAALAVARVGRVEETGDRLLPFRLLDEQGAEVPAVTEFLHHMLADDASPASLRSYAYELLPWFRFLDAVMVSWDLAGRAEARDFALWLKTVKKPARQRRPDAPAPDSVNPVTGKAAPGENYAARTRRHARTVIRSFYEYHREMHGRPLVNPFPQAKGAEEGQLNAHHNPMQPFRQPSRRAQYQPKEPKPAPRSIPDQAFNNLFAGLACNRDRALIAFYVSTGARASELLGVPQGLVAPEEQTIALRSGMPPHIAAKICGHALLDTTMGYAAIYPEDVVSHHRAFIARRRAERPSEEYRDLTVGEWDEFLAHFELRKVALGVCGRDYGTPCAHENACVRCPLLRVDPAQIPRLEEIHANLGDRLQEAREQGWLGEVAAIETTLAAAVQKLEAMRGLATVHLGIPDVRSATARFNPGGG